MGSAGTSLRRTGISATEGLFEPCKGLLCSFLAVITGVGGSYRSVKMPKLQALYVFGFSPLPYPKP